MIKHSMKEFPKNDARKSVLSENNSGVYCR